MELLMTLAFLEFNQNLTSSQVLYLDIFLSTAKTREVPTRVQE